MIQRIEEQALVKLLDHKEILILTGPRQVGKTTMMKNLFQYAIVERKKPAIWLNLDVDDDARHFISQKELLAKIDLELGNDGGYVFIDEIQRVENAGLFLKGIYDSRDDLKFIVSGSGSLELKEKIVESLSGRKRQFQILPISFDEFLDYKTNYKYSKNLAQYKSIETESVQHYFHEYIMYGGFPRVITSKTADEKRTVLQEILSSYLMRDVRLFVNIHNYDSYGKLFSALSHQVGRQTKYTSLAQIINLSSVSVKEYIWYMQHTFMIESTTPFYSNAISELTKEPIIYFTDTGILNLQRNNLFDEMNSPSFGFVFQNFVYNQIRWMMKDQYIEIKYWRTKDKAEVDIILDIRRKIIPIEVKYQNMKIPSIPRALVNFIHKYKPAEAFIVTKSIEMEMKVEDTMVYFIPYWQIGRIKILCES